MYKDIARRRYDLILICRLAFPLLGFLLSRNSEMKNVFVVGINSYTYKPTCV